MPGPGPHMMYAMGSGLALTSLSNGRFTPHHTLAYTVNAFFGPDIGSFSEWLGSTITQFGFGSASQTIGSFIADAVHHPLYYVLILGLPLCLLYAWASKFLIRRGVLDSLSGMKDYYFNLDPKSVYQVLKLTNISGPHQSQLSLFGVEMGLCQAPLSRKQCMYLISAGSLSHFFLDHLFEENGHSSMYTWILSTGWWETRARVNPDAVFVTGFLCISLICGFIYINRMKSLASIERRSYQSVRLMVTIASVYCVWCGSQIYWVNPRQPAVGEEADLGVVIFLAVFFFLPHGLCIMSINSKDVVHTQIPL